MGSILSSDNPFFTFINKLFAFIQLSALWVVFSIPIITMGAATSALYYAANKHLRNNRDYIWTAFWGSFKKNFKQSTIVWLVFVVVAAIFAVDGRILYIFAEAGNGIGNTYVIFIILFAVEMVFALWVLIYISRIQDKTKTILKNCMALFFYHFPTTILMVFLLGLGAFAIWFLPLLMFIVPSGLAYLLSYKIEKIFKIYMSEEDIALEEELNKNENENGNRKNKKYRKYKR